jgi:cellulose synthase/poly-beta-1,6-N-acetylglucosamine synthase-like glycosyltransferase
MFLDADVRVHPDTLGRAYQELTSRDTIGAMFGAYDDTPLASGLVSQYRNLLHHFTHCSSQTKAWTFWAGCGLIRRDLFMQHGGFDERYRTPSVEDIELGMRLSSVGVEIVLVPGVQVCHAKSWTLWNMMRTDITQRAWPWSLLLAGSVPDDLNLRWDQRAGALCAWLTVGFAGGVFFGKPVIWAGIFAAAATALCNHRFLRFLARLKGLSFAARAFPIHLLFLLYSSATFVAGTAAALTGGGALPRLRPPETVRIGNDT